MTITLPAPIGGLNVRDSLDSMQATDAVVMDNYIPVDTKVMLRRGYVRYVLLNAPVNTLVEYNKPNENRLLAVSGGKLHNVSSKSHVTTFDNVTFSDTHCQTVQQSLFPGQTCRIHGFLQCFYPVIEHISSGKAIHSFRKILQFRIRTPKITPDVTCHMSLF